jgi:hypothetical protein
LRNNQYKWLIYIHINIHTYTYIYIYIYIYIYKWNVTEMYPITIQLCYLQTYLFLFISIFVFVNEHYLFCIWFASHFYFPLNHFKYVQQKPCFTTRCNGIPGQPHKVGSCRTGWKSDCLRQRDPIRYFPSFSDYLKCFSLVSDHRIH